MYSGSDDLVVLMFKDIPFSINKNILAKESSVFEAMFSENWKSEPTITGETMEALNNKKMKMVNIYEIEGFSPLAAKSVFDYLLGFQNTCNYCTSFVLLGEMLKLCDFYGITKPIGDIKSRIEGTAIKLSNIVDAYETGEALKMIDQFNNISTYLSSRCVRFARCNLASSQGLLMFVVENSCKVDTVSKLLRNVRDDDKVSLSFKVNGKERFEEGNTLQSNVCIAKNLEWSISVSIHSNGKDFRCRLNCNSKNSSTKWSIKMKSIIIGIYNWDTKEFLQKNVPPKTISDSITYECLFAGTFSSSWKDDSMLIEVLMDIEDCPGMPLESDTTLDECPWMNNPGI